MLAMVWNAMILVCFSVMARVCKRVSCILFSRSVHARCAFYESSFSSRLSVLAIFRGGAVFSPSAWSCSRFFAAFFLSHCWWRYRSRIFVFSVTIICSDGYSLVGRYTDGRRFDALHTESEWNLVKLFLLYTGNPFRKSPFSISAGVTLLVNDPSTGRVETSRCYTSS